MGGAWPCTPSRRGITSLIAIVLSLLRGHQQMRISYKIAILGVITEFQLAQSSIFAVCAGSVQRCRDRLREAFHVVTVDG